MEISLEPDFPRGSEEDYIDTVVESITECQCDISYNLHLKDRWKDNATIVWQLDELIKEGQCHLQWLRVLRKRTRKEA